MLERWITALHTEDAGLETAASTRDRLKDHFPKNATRRMSQLGLLIGTVLEPLHLGYDDALIYASAYAETCALEGYLDSFPNPSPTLFQTSIHPSAVQQSLITRQRPIRQFLPLTGGVHLPAQALLAAFLAGTPLAVLCGGEERGSWLLDHGRASDRTFAFALALTHEPAPGALARISFDFEDQSSRPAINFSLPDFFDHLHNRRPVDACVLPGRRLRLEWMT